MDTERKKNGLSLAQAEEVAVGVAGIIAGVALGVGALHVPQAEVQHGEASFRKPITTPKGELIIPSTATPTSVRKENLQTPSAFDEQMSGLEKGEILLALSNSPAGCDFVQVSAENGNVIIEKGLLPADGHEASQTMELYSESDKDEVRAAISQALAGRKLIVTLLSDESGSVFRFADECDVDIYHADGTNTEQIVKADGSVTTPEAFK